MYAIRSYYGLITIIEDYELYKYDRARQRGGAYVPRVENRVINPHQVYLANDRNNFV